MKRILSVLLMITLATSVFANGAEDAASTSAGSASAADFTWNGQKEVWSILPTTNAEGLMIISNAMGAAMEAQGWKYVAKDAAGDPGKQVTFIEDAIASKKVGAIMCAAMAVDMLKDVAQRAIEAGIPICYLGALPKDYTINAALYTAYEITGMFAIEMVEAWASNNNPPADKKGIPVALDVYDDIEDGQYRSNAFRDRTEESSSLYVYNTNVTYGNDAQNKGYNWAENMMTANPDLRIFVCYEPDCMVGVVSFLSKYSNDNGMDMNDFCVVNCYFDSATTEEFEKAKADPSSTPFKGYVTYGEAPPITGQTLAMLLLGASDGSWEFGDVYYDPVYTFATFDFSMSWKMGEENPAKQYKY